MSNRLLDENGRVDVNKVRSQQMKDKNVGVEKVDPRLCARWRRAAGGERNVDAQAAEARVRKNTVRNHVNGNCVHDHGVPPLEYDRSVGPERGGLWVEPDE